MQQIILQARDMLTEAVEVFSRIATQRPNKASTTGYIVAMLEAK